MQIMTSVNRAHYPLAWTLGQTVHRQAGQRLAVYDLDGELPETEFLDPIPALDLAPLLGTRPPASFHAPKTGPPFSAHKPRAIHRALQKHERVLYLDADMLVLRRLVEWSDDIDLAVTVREVHEFRPERMEDSCLNIGYLYWHQRAAPLVKAWCERTAACRHDQEALCRLFSEAGCDWNFAAEASLGPDPWARNLSLSEFPTKVHFLSTLHWNYYYEPLNPMNVPTTACVVHFRSVLQTPRRGWWYKAWCRELELQEWPDL